MGAEKIKSHRELRDKIVFTLNFLLVVVSLMVIAYTVCLEFCNILY